MANQNPVTRPKAARSAVPAELNPRERLLSRGAAALSDAEVLSVILQNGSPAAPALDQAVELLRRIGGFPGFLRLGAGKLQALGLTPAKAAAVASALELSRRLVRNELPHRPLLDRPGLVARYAAAGYRSPDQQVLGALFLDACCRLPGRPAPLDVEIFRGTLTTATVEPRAVFHRALAASAVFVIVFQTRTSGDPVPTRADWSFTHRLVEAGEILGIGVRDHLLVASAEQWVSLHRRHPWSGAKGWRGPSSGQEACHVPAG